MSAAGALATESPRTTLECLQALYYDIGDGADGHNRHPADMEWSTYGVPLKLPLDIFRDVPYFTREVRRDVPGIFQGAMYAAMGLAGAKAIEAVAYGSHRRVPACGRVVTKRDVDEAVYLCLSERYGDRRLENAANYIWLHLVRVVYAETPLEEIVKLAR